MFAASRLLSVPSRTRRHLWHLGSEIDLAKTPFFPLRDLSVSRFSRANRRKIPRSPRRAIASAFSRYHREKSGGEAEGATNGCCEIASDIERAGRSPREHVAATIASACSEKIEGTLRSRASSTGTAGDSRLLGEFADSVGVRRPEEAWDELSRNICGAFAKIGDRSRIAASIRRSQPETALDPCMGTIAGLVPWRESRRRQPYETGIIKVDPWKRSVVSMVECTNVI